MYGSSGERDAYSKKYTKGPAQRNDNTGYQSGRGGYVGHERTEDLLGMDAVRAYDQMERRGFRQQKEHSNDGKTYRVWYNSKTDQCIKTVSENKRISEVMRSTHCN